MFTNRLPFRAVWPWGLLAVLLAGVQAAEPETGGPETPRQLWKRCQPTLPPFRYEVVRDETVASDIDPRQRLRRVEFSFVSQELFGQEIRHRGVAFLPTNPRFTEDPERRGKVVVVGSLQGPWRESFLSNYGQSIAVRTGYPTMVLPVPGETADRPGEEYSIRPLIKLVNETNDPIDHHFFRLAIPFLRGMEVFAELLGIDQTEIRAVIGGHSKRATAAYTAAAIRPDNVAGIVYMGNENVYDKRTGTPLEATSPYFTQRFVRCPVLYVGATNEGGYAMFNINKVQTHMDPPWVLEIIPNYRHASESEKQFLAWPMWVSHVFDGRPLTKIHDLKHRQTESGTEFSVRIDSPNRILLVYAWYVYCDDVPYWRDLMWYPMTMRKQESNLYTSYLPGKLPDAWLVEVLDVACGFRGYVSSLPINLSGKPAVTKKPGNGLPRLWRPNDSNGEPSPGSPIRPASIAAALDQLVPKLMASLHVPGVSIVGIEDRRIAWDRQYGVRCAGGTDKVDRDTVFEACSMSKTPLAYLVLKLVERGEFDLDEPLTNYLDEPYLADEPLHKRITARMVVSHTSGFPNWRKGGWRSGGPLPVLFEPGTRFGYSGEGFLYLQRVVEHVTGTPFEKYVERELFEPLGITISSYVWQDRFEKLAAAGHDAEGRVKPNRPLYRRANAGYSLYCTPYEYAKFLVEIIKEDRSARHSLSAASIDAMLTRTTKATGRKPIVRAGESSGDTVYWGLGWPIDETTRGDRVYHSGSNGTGFRCYSEFDRRRGTGIVIMTNAVGGKELWQRVMAEVGPP